MIQIKRVSLIFSFVCLFSFSVLAKTTETVLEPLPSGHLLVDVTINKNTIKFVVDTGASSSVIDKHFAKTLALKSLDNEPTIKAFTPGANILEMQQYQVDGVDVGGLIESPVVFVEQDLSPMFQGLSHHQIGGIIGQEVLAKFGLLLDISKKKLFLPNAELLQGYTPIALQPTVMGLSYINTNINQINMNMLIDSGATEVMIDKAMAIKNNLGNISYESGMQGVNDDGSTRDIGFIESSTITLAGKRMDSILLVDDFSSILSQINQTLSNDQVCGLIGINALANLSAIIDVKNQKLYIN
jgi:predicted aspartyl protease